MQPPDTKLISRLLGLVNAVLYDGCKAFADTTANSAIRLAKISKSAFLSIQRETIVSFDGNTCDMAVHCKQLSKPFQEKI